MQALLWVTSVWFGVSIGPLFPCILALPPALNLSGAGRHMAVLIAGANIGNTLIPFMTGKLMDKWILSLPVVCFTCSGVALVRCPWLMYLLPSDFPASASAVWSTQGDGGPLSVHLSA
jgi:hypothetical protein